MRYYITYAMWDTPPYNIEHSLRKLVSITTPLIWHNHRLITHKSFISRHSYWHINLGAQQNLFIIYINYSTFIFHMLLFFPQGFYYVIYDFLFHFFLFFFCYSSTFSHTHNLFKASFFFIYICYNKREKCKLKLKNNYYHFK